MLENLQCSLSEFEFRVKEKIKKESPINVVSDNTNGSHLYISIPVKNRKETSRIGSTLFVKDFRRLLIESNMELVTITLMMIKDHVQACPKIILSIAISVTHVEYINLGIVDLGPSVTNL